MYVLLRTNLLVVVTKGLYRSVVGTKGQVLPPVWGSRGRGFKPRQPDERPVQAACFR